MIEILTGKEQYLITKRKEELLEGIDEMDVSYFETFSEEVYELLNTFPIMSDKRGILIDANKLSDMDNTYFHNYVKQPSDFSILLVILRECDLRVKFALDLKKRGFLKIYDKVSERELEVVIRKEIFSHGASIDDVALKELLKRENYAKNESISLFSIMNDILPLILTEKILSLELVQKKISYHEVENIFSLAKLIFENKPKELRHQLNLLSSDKAIPTLSLILREYRLAYKKAIGFSEKDIGVDYINLKLLPKDKLKNGIRILTEIIQDIKSGKMDSNYAMQAAVNQLLED